MEGLYDKVNGVWRKLRADNPRVAFMDDLA